MTSIKKDKLKDTVLSLLMEFNSKSGKELVHINMSLLKNYLTLFESFTVI